MNCYRLKETKEILQMHAIFDAIPNPALCYKGHYWVNSQNWHADSMLIYRVCE